MTVREIQNQLLELKKMSISNSVADSLLFHQQELAKPGVPPLQSPRKIGVLSRFGTGQGRCQD